MKITAILFIALCLFSLALNAQAEETGIVGQAYSFENGPEGWIVPNWALEKVDHVCRGIAISEHEASDGKYSIEMLSDFAGDNWQGVYMELEMDTDMIDWSDVSSIRADMYMPPFGPYGLVGKFILTVGEDWKWHESEYGMVLKPGEWITLRVDMHSTSNDWGAVDVGSMKRIIKKFGVRVESEDTAYTGPIYIDNIVIE
ncbi:MAG: hypothetical protein HQ593_01785 [Candidatus Omnitrophica bacterium]|nr:hypothetical protein [Candidatus Omnitrophota bacterium]